MEDASGMAGGLAGGLAGLDDLLEARRRIVAAFEGIAAGAEALAARRAPASDTAPGADPEELARLRAELDEERLANAQLEARVKALRDRAEAPPAIETELASARAELAALRAERATLRAELDAVLSELAPILEEAQ